MDFFLITLACLVGLAFHTLVKCLKKPRGERLRVIWSVNRMAALVFILFVHVIDRSIETKVHSRHIEHGTEDVKTHVDKAQETVIARVEGGSNDIKTAIKDLPLPPQEILAPPSDEPEEILNVSIGGNKLINPNRNPSSLVKLGTSTLRVTRRFGVLTLSATYVGPNNKTLLNIGQNKFYPGSKDGYRIELGPDNNSVDVYDPSGKSILHCITINDTVVKLNGVFWNLDGTEGIVWDDGMYNIADAEFSGDGDGVPEFMHQFITENIGAIADNYDPTKKTSPHFLESGAKSKP